MSVLIDAKGFGCAQPVILARNALELYDEITIVVDERAALENLKILGMNAGWMVRVTEELGGICSIRLSKTSVDGKMPSTEPGE